jgi:hypothetical protein
MMIMRTEIQCMLSSQILIMPLYDDSSCSDSIIFLLVCCAGNVMGQSGRELMFSDSGD